MSIQETRHCDKMRRAHESCRNFYFLIIWIVFTLESYDHSLVSKKMFGIFIFFNVDNFFCCAVIYGEGYTIKMLSVLVLVFYQ